MSSLLTIVPSRGRPTNIKDLVNACLEVNTKSDFVIAVDDDDPNLAEYKEILKAEDDFFIHVGPRVRLGGTLNLVSHKYSNKYDYIGFMGDDHRPRTSNWDVKIIQALESLGSGIVYGNDLVWGAGLPTAAFMSSDIIKTLGYMVPPGMIHMYIDNFWLILGKELRRIVYLDDVVIEHMHPSVGKANVDESYLETNNENIYSHDRELFQQYCQTQLASDVDKLNA